MAPRTALITGINGQDGSYLADLLLEKGYQVHGLVRPSLAPEKLENLRHLEGRIELHAGDLGDPHFIQTLMATARPQECYHLAASSFVSYSFDDESSILSAIHGTHNLLAALKANAPSCRFYYAGSSEMFGHAPHSPQGEFTPFNPRSIYGIAKLAGYHLVRNYREKDGLFASVGILYNHESPRRGPAFVTRKITSTVARIKLGLETKLELGNLDALRDWGYAPDYVRAMWLMLQQERGDDFVVATGRNHSVREFVDCAFKIAGLDYRQYVTYDARHFRPGETVPLVGNSAKARAELGWKPTREFQDIIREMVSEDLRRFEAGAKL